MFNIFKRKKVQEDIIGKIPPIYREKILTGDDILNSACPWSICKTDFFDNKEAYKIKVFLFDSDNEWDYFTKYSREVIGVSKEEILRVLEEKFNAYIINKDYSLNSREAIFFDIEDAIKAIEEFKTYYDSFYMPRAVARRLLCYKEGGYPPYFMDEYDGPVISDKKNSENC